jgi:hypothetical protein
MLKESTDCSHEKLIKSVVDVQNFLRLSDHIVHRDKRRILAVLFGWRHEFQRNLTTLTNSQARNETILSFIAKYGGDNDADEECWAAKQLQMINEIKQWNAADILKYVEVYEREWNQIWTDFHFPAGRSNIGRRSNGPFGSRR